MWDESITENAGALVLDGLTNSDSFVGFCQGQLVPNLFPGDLVVMDNLSSHQAPRVIDAIEQTSAWAVDLTAYSPNLNPIEKIFAKLKQIIRGLAPRSWAEIINAARDALLKKTRHEIEATFEHCGYVTT